MCTEHISVVITQPAPFLVTFKLWNVCLNLLVVGDKEWWQNWCLSFHVYSPSYHTTHFILVYLTLSITRRRKCSLILFFNFTALGSAGNFSVIIVMVTGQRVGICVSSSYVFITIWQIPYIYIISQEMEQTNSRSEVLRWQVLRKFQKHSPIIPRSHQTSHLEPYQSYC